MKPKSIISLIVAAALVLCGIVTCTIASFKAKSSDIMLFPEADSDGNLVYRVDLENITKLNITTADADVTVIGGAERSEIEIVNFNANYYKLSQSNGSLVFVEVDDFLSMFKFWDNGFSFKGMRYILRFGDDAAGDKRIIVHLTDEDALRLADIKTASGDISIKSCPFEAYYTLSSEGGSVLLDRVSGASMISISSKSAPLALDMSSCGTDELLIAAILTDATVTDTNAAAFTATLPAGSLTLSKFTAETASITSENADITFNPYSISEGTITTVTGDLSFDLKSAKAVSANVTTKSGKLSLDGKFTDSYTKSSADPAVRLMASTVGGNITIITK